MSKTLCVGVNQTARKVAGVYAGVDQIAHHVTRGYVGVGGIARMFYALAKGPTRHGAVELTVCISAVGTGQYALFAGDLNVAAYDETLTRHAAGTLSMIRTHHVAVMAGSCALIAGAYRDYGGGYIALSRVVDAYDETLTRTTITSLSVTAQFPAAARAGDKAVIAIGNNTVSNVSNVVNVYDAALTRSTAPTLSVARKNAMGASFGGAAVFAGGLDQSGAALDVMDVYDAALTRTSPAALSGGCVDGAGVATEAHVLFGGGTRNDAPSSVVDAFDLTFARLTVPPLWEPRAGLGTAVLDGYAMFAGGSQSVAVEAYDATLAHLSLEPLIAGGDRFCGAAVGEYALFSGDVPQGTAYQLI